MHSYGLGQMLPQNYMLQQPGMVPNPMTNINPMLGISGLNNPGCSGTIKNYTNTARYGRS
jgi:hypothetical protein